MRTIVSDEESENGRHEEIVGSQIGLWITVLVLISCAIPFPFLFPKEFVGKNIFWYWFFVAFMFFFTLTWPPAHYYYGISESGITEYWLGRKKRIIPWNDVRQIGLQRDLGKYSPALFVTLKGAPLFKIEKRTGTTKYWRENRPNVLYIMNGNSAAKVISKYYGTLDY